MVKYRLKGKLIDTSTTSEIETLRKLGLGGIYSDVNYRPGSYEAKEQRKLRAIARDTMIIEEGFTKIVFVDYGSFTCKEFEANDHIETIIDYELYKEEGEPRTRLIFLKKDRDYWPGSEKDPDAMARRAEKEMFFAAGERFVKPDYQELTVAPLTKDAWEIDLSDTEGILRESFNRYFDPYLPGTKFILENMDTNLYKTLLDCMAYPDLRSIWVNSPLAGIIQIPDDRHPLYPDGLGSNLHEVFPEETDGHRVRCMNKGVVYYPGSSCVFKVEEDLLEAEKGWCSDAVNLLAVSGLKVIVNAGFKSENTGCDV